MTKEDPGKNKDDKDQVTGAAGLAKIARGLSDLFNVLADFDRLPRRGRHEKNGVVMDYSFGSRPLRGGADGDAGDEDAPDDGSDATDASARSEMRPRRAAKRSSLEVLEPVTDMFDEPGEILLLFELPGVERKDVRCILDGDILLLEAKTGDRLYRKEMLIEEKLAAAPPHLNLHNGILEVRLTKVS